MAATSSSPAPFIDWSLLGHVVVYSVVIGVGLVVAFSFGLAALSLARGTGRSALVRVTGSIVSVVMVAAIASALVWGLILIVKK
jgi:hypothetical protein